MVLWAAESGASPSDDQSTAVALWSQLLVPVFLVSQAGELIQLKIVLVKKKGFDEIKCLNQLTACLLTPAAAGKQERERGWGKKIDGTSACSEKHMSDMREHRSGPSGF